MKEINGLTSALFYADEKWGIYMSKLMQCPMCEKMISPNAVACPNCGEPIASKIKVIESNDIQPR